MGKHHTFICPEPEVLQGSTLSAAIDGSEEPVATSIEMKIAASRLSLCTSRSAPKCFAFLRPYLPKTPWEMETSQKVPKCHCMPAFH
jgi:hypothetical protein